MNMIMSNIKIIPIIKQVCVDWMVLLMAVLLVLTIVAATILSLYRDNTVWIMPLVVLLSMFFFMLIACFTKHWFFRNLQFVYLTFLIGDLYKFIWKSADHNVFFELIEGALLIIAILGTLLAIYFISIILIHKLYKRLENL